MYKVDVNKCNGCGICVNVCPHQAITIDPYTKRAEIDINKCDGCGACVSYCHSEAIKEQHN